MESKNMGIIHEKGMGIKKPPGGGVDEILNVSSYYFKVFSDKLKLQPGYLKLIFETSNHNF